MDKDKAKLFHFSEQGKFFKTLDLMKKIPNTPSRTAVFLYDKRYDLITVFSEFESESNYIKKFIEIEEDNEKRLYLCEIERDDKTKEESLYLIVYKDKRIAILISNQSKDGWKSSVGFFRRFYPFLVRIFLRSFQILEVLNYVENNSKLNLIAKSYVAKRYFGNPRSEICWEKINYKKAFEQAMSNNLWIDSIWIGIEEGENSIGTVRLNRKGIFSYNGISFYEFYNKFIIKVIDFFLKTYISILENKSRSVSMLEPKPVKITLSDDVFTEKDSFDKLIQNIRHSLKNWGYSTLSQDNMLGQIMLHDYETGSSFDLHVSSSREIYIIPQTQVTEISFNRLLTFVLDNFEGDVEDANN